jgi:hypothetical protein
MLNVSFTGKKNCVKVNSEKKMFSTELTEGAVPLLHRASLLSI